MTPGAVEMVPILRPAFARVRIANEIRMQFRRERKSGSTVSLQETLEADGESALTLADVLQPGANDVYEIKTPKGMMYLAALPFVIKHVDAKAGVIVVDEARLPEVAVFED